MKQFKAEIVFPNMDEAKAAEDELRTAGFQVEITDAVDIYSAAVFVNVSCAGEVDLADELCRIVDPMDGFVSEFGTE